MRYLLAIAFACMIGMPSASAMPTLGSNMSLKAISNVQMVKHIPRTSRNSRRSNTGGIHPLVGSGNY
jgi:hypothetical protein